MPGNWKDWIVMPLSTTDDEEKEKNGKWDSVSGCRLGVGGDQFRLSHSGATNQDTSLPSFSLT